MTTFHPSAKRLHNGTFIATVMIRNAKGQCVGSVAMSAFPFANPHAARNRARLAAHVAANNLSTSNVFAKVA
jgi:hypothetical protein